MQIEVSPEVLLSQLGYTKTASSLKQAENIMEETKDFDKFSKHVISLNDNLKKLNAYVALSNSTEHLKIKCDQSDSSDVLEEFYEKVNNWANKYNIQLQKLDNKPVFYILGLKQ